MGIDARAAWALRDALNAKGKAEAGRTDAAEVTRIDEEGTVWVHIAGGVEETPVNGTLAASVGVGDSVTVSIENGRLSVLGNSTAPSVGQTYVEQSVAPAVTAAAAAQTSSDIARAASERAVAEATTAHAAAEYAVGKAEDAAEAAEDAQDSADAAQASADAAQTSANAAQGSADAALASAGRAEQGAQYAREYAEEALGKSAEATEAANAATTSLSVVQDVIGTLEWISEHGTYTLTSDVTVDPTKVYFTRSGTDPDYTYTPVTEPKDEELATYYELSMDEAMAEFVGAHLALLSDGLHVVSDTSGYYIVLGNDAMRVYDPNGVMVGQFGSSVILRESAGKDVTISPSWLRLRFGAMHLGVTHVGTQFEVNSSGLLLTKSNAWSSLEPFHVQTVNMPDEYKSGGAHYDEDAAQYLVSIGLARSGIEGAECDYQLSLGDWNVIEALDAVALGDNLHVASRGQVVTGRYNVADATGEYLLIIGNGADDSNRSDAFTVDWNGNVEATGDLIAGGDVSDSTGTLDQVRQDSKNASNITSGTLSVSHGGTGASTAAGAVTNIIFGQAIRPSSVSASGNVSGVSFVSNNSIDSAASSVASNNCRRFALASDTNGVQYAFVEAQKLTDGRVGNALIAYRSVNGTAKYNQITPYIDNNGNMSYGVSDAAAFRSAIQVAPTLLWSGDTNGNVTLSQTCANFTRITIMFRDNDNQYGSVEVFEPNGKTVIMASSWQGRFQKMRTVKFNGTAMTNVQAYQTDTVDNHTDATNLIYTRRVFGWKY